MFNPSHRLGLPPRFSSGLVSGDFHNSARTAIRSRLCGPNTFSPLPMLDVFRGFFVSLRPSPFFKRPGLASPNFPKNTIRSRLCGPNTLPSIHLWSVFWCFFAKMHWFAALRPCFTAPKPCLAVFCKKRDPLTPVRSKHAFAPSIFPFFPRKCVFFTAPEPFF